mmetsp:Transcript_11560/g.22741  ORF Transcript_11560/g.22741 Transcript_11560/m.22741 type:complete len:306 (-) Transcript_11560:2131-3048(-)|eukprot:CAMPEP_0171501358 /NCGR_PEP_ID=MMETSP0958-20121227/9514_1 /TAXON_ID=87120 /ORGANISM="Aurantiochytrium limacinum, Strain ATCCMYA-1381" /LENGTH=305 /DNA_ID=CAMNT_0012036165 /DNA_START=103 /DNA_END=1020 /DNA_ORIENTATION=+
MTFCEVNTGGASHRIWYEVSGAAEEDAKHRMLFTMGLGSDSRLWKIQVDYFSKLPGYRVCTYDNRGIGFSDPVPGRWTTREMAQDALALMDHLGWQKDVNLVGTSMGGMITLEIACQDIPRFASVTLASTIAGGIPSLLYFATVLHSGLYKLVRLAAAQTQDERGKWFLSCLFPDEFVKLEDEAHPGQSNADSLQQYFLDVTKEEPGREQVTGTTFIKQCFAAATHSVSSSKLRNLGESVSVLVLTGDVDIVVPPANSERLAREIPNCHFLKVSGAGHGVLMQNREFTNQAIQSLIERQPIRTEP